jgi:hypothetical protein
MGMMANSEIFDIAAALWYKYGNAVGAVLMTDIAIMAAGKMDAIHVGQWRLLRQWAHV